MRRKVGKRRRRLRRKSEWVEKGNRERMKNGRKEMKKRRRGVIWVGKNDLGRDKGRGLSKRRDNNRVYSGRNGERSREVVSKRRYVELVKIEEVRKRENEWKRMNISENEEK